MTLRRARLVLEDGSCFEGVGCGAEGVTSGEVVFNTSMTGYQEILTDPSYAGQIVTMTCPEMGNYGTTALDARVEAAVRGRLHRARVFAPGQQLAVVGALHDFLAAHGIVALAGIDTRALTRRLRSGGVLRGAIGTGDVERRGARGARAADAADGGRRPGARRHVRRGVRLRVSRRRARCRATPGVADRPRVRARRRTGARRAAAGRAPAAGGRVRLRDEVEHPPAASRRTAARVRVFPATTPASDVLARDARRRLPEQRSRRPGGAALRRAERARAARPRPAAVRHLPRPPAARARARRRGPSS